MEGQRHHHHHQHDGNPSIGGNPMGMGSLGTGAEDYRKEEKHHKHHEHLGELGAAAAGAYALVCRTPY